MAKKITKIETQTIPEAKEINHAIKDYIIDDVLKNHPNLVTLAKKKPLAPYDDLSDISYIKVYTTKDEITGIILRFSVVEKLKIDDLTFVRVIYSDYQLDDYIRERSILTATQPPFVEKYKIFKNRSDTLKRIKDKEDKESGKKPKKEEQPPAEDKMDNKLKTLYKYAEYLTKRVNKSQTYEDYAGEELDDSDDVDGLSKEEIAVKFSEYDRLPKLPPEGIFMRVRKIKDIVFDNLYVIDRELYRETKGTTGKDAIKKMTSKENQKGEKIFRVSYIDNDKEKSVIFNMTRFRDGKKDNIIMG